MSEIAVSLGPGLLRDVHERGVLTWGDVHVAQKVGFLFGEADQRVLLAVALTIRALREGSTCLEIDRLHAGAFDGDTDLANPLPTLPWPTAEEWDQALSASPLITPGSSGDPDRPLRLVGPRLYLERYWQEETTVAEELVARRAAGNVAPELADVAAAAAELISTSDDPDQAAAAVVPLYTGVSVIAGGPGTGKTYTLARVLAMVTRVAKRPPLIGLAAPTGKAAVRMEESMATALVGMPSDIAAALGALRATTIHRLLGWVPDSRNRFRHHRGNPLPHDVVVIDEASMVSVTLMARLLEALRPGARLVLVGDPNQLAPVEAGAVLADIAEAPTAPLAALDQALRGLDLDAPAVPVARLHRNHRSGQAIAALAEAVLAGDADRVIELVQAGGDEVHFAETVAESRLRELTVATGVGMIRAARSGRVDEALAQLESHRLLCAHRRGPYGVAHWSRNVEDWLAAAMPDFDPTPLWYPGRPILITQNSPELGLFNGDTGVVVNLDGVLRATFARGAQRQHISPFVLDAVQTIHAMTVHKAQGSQFEHVSLLLPSADSPLLTRELLYTAITRASKQVHVIGSVESLRRAVDTRARRASGLLARL